jgi:hypothetical protein
METRSKRRQATTQSQAYPQIQVAAPQTAPATPSAFQSANSFNTTASQNQMMMLQTHQPLASAPLPSPSSSNNTNNYFGTLSQQPPTSHPAQQQRIPQSQTIAGNYLGQRGDGAGTPETAPFLKDFNLVAEAAKRAQVACLARDLGDVGL